MFTISRNPQPAADRQRHPKHVAEVPDAGLQAAIHAQIAAVAHTLWTLEHVAVFLHVSLDTVLRMRAAGILPPPIRLGRAVRWLPATIIHWALTHTEPTR